MTLIALDIPDSDAELPSWLEGRLTGLDLADAIAGLEVFRDRPESPPSLDSVLSGQQAALLERGLSVLQPTQLRTLLRHPRLLLDLQERVLVHGGAYWRQRSSDPAQQRLVEIGWTAVESHIAPQSQRGSGGGIAARRAPWAKLLTAAVLLLGAFIGWQQYQSRLTPTTGWGWDKPGAGDECPRPAVPGATRRRSQRLVQPAPRGCGRPAHTAHAVPRRLRHTPRGPAHTARRHRPRLAPGTLPRLARKDRGAYGRTRRGNVRPRSPHGRGRDGQQVADRPEGTGGNGRLRQFVLRPSCGEHPGDDFASRWSSERNGCVPRDSHADQGVSPPRSRVDCVDSCRHRVFAVTSSRSGKLGRSR